MITATTIPATAAENRHLPLEPLFTLLKKNSFQVKPDDYIEILKIVERFGTDDIDETVKYICPVVATNENEQVAFYKIVETYKALYATGSSGYSKKKSRLFVFVALLAIVTITVIYILYKPSAKIVKAAEHTAVHTAEPVIVTDSNNYGKIDSKPTLNLRTLKNYNFDSTNNKYSIDITAGKSDISINPLKLKYAIWVSALLLLPGFSGLIFSIFKRKVSDKKKAVVDSDTVTNTAGNQQIKKPPFQIPFERNDLKLIYEERDLSQILLQMRYKTLEDTFAFNIPKTVYSTIRSGGMPDFIYTPGTRQQEYLVLIDRTNPKSMFVSFFEYFVMNMKERDIPVVCFYYDQQLTCFNNSFPLGITLDRLAQIHNSATLLLFGKGHELVFRAYAVIEELVMKKLDQWQMKAIVTPIPFGEWGERERVISTRILLLPADLMALARLVPTLKENLLTPGRYLEAHKHAWYGTNYIDFRDLNEIKEYLDNDETIFQWLCAVCIFPKLRWEVLVETGKRILEKYKQAQNLNYTSLLKFCRISWMWEGVIPQQIRTELLACLTVENEVIARQTLLEMFRFSNTFYDSDFFFKDQLELQQVTNEFILYAHDKDAYGNFEKSEKVFQQLWESNKILDAPLKKYLTNDNREQWQTPINENGKSVGLNSYFDIKNESQQKRVQKSLNKRRILIGSLSLLIVAFWAFLISGKGEANRVTGILYTTDSSQMIPMVFKINYQLAACNIKSFGSSDLGGSLKINEKQYPARYNENDSSIHFEIPYSAYNTKDSSTLNLSLKNRTSFTKNLKLSDRSVYGITLLCQNIAQPSQSSYTPLDFAKIYNFPIKGNSSTPLDGTGQRIAIIELGGGYRNEDLKKYFNDLGVQMPDVSSVSLYGAKNNPTNINSADGQVMGDIEVIGTVAPGAKLVVYFSVNTDQGFTDVLKKAVSDKSSIVCINWGSPEANWTKAALNNFNDALKAAADQGVTVCVASGDAGASDGMPDKQLHVDFPAASPYVLACGGTKLVIKGNEVTSEIAWNTSSQSATGGGMSTVFPMPDYQKNIRQIFGDVRFSGRAIPDISANADPDVGYKIFVDGEYSVIGGTSMSTPLIAGLIALVNQGSGYNVGFINPLLYSKIGPSEILYDIKTGDNKTDSIGYTASPGWDPVTGWGSPNGKRLLEFFKKEPQQAVEQQQTETLQQQQPGSKSYNNKNGSTKPSKQKSK